MKHYATLLATATVLVACGAESQKPNTAATKPKVADSTHVITQATQANDIRPFFNQPAASVAETGFLANPNVQAFIRYNVQQNGMNEAELQQFFSHLRN